MISKFMIVVYFLISIFCILTISILYLYQSERQSFHPIYGINRTYHPCLVKEIHPDYALNIFSNDTHNYRDKIHLNEQNATIILLSLNITTNKNNSLNISSELGTGVVIHNSATYESGGYNAVITASHLMKQDENQNQAESCASLERICLAYNPQGQYLGHYDLLERSEDTNNSTKRDFIKDDVITIKIIPDNHYYENIYGVNLARVQNNIPFITDIVSNRTGYGASYGLSGGGVFNTYGELLGIISSGMNSIYDKNKQIHIEEQQGYSYNPIFSLLEKQTKNQNIDDYPASIIFQMLEEHAFQNPSYGKDIALIPTIQNKKILSSLGYAGKNIKTADIPYYTNLTVYGYTDGNAIEYRVPKTLDFILDNNLQINSLPNWLVRTFNL